MSLNKPQVLAVVLVLLPAALAQAQGPDVPCAEFRVNTYTNSEQGRPDVAAAANGSFLVVWRGENGIDESRGVFGQRFDAAGVPQGAEFTVNTHTLYAQSYPQVAATVDGGFVVVWASDAQDGYRWGVFGQRLDAAGAPVGPEFQVNTYTAANEFSTSVAAGPGGGFVVTWTDYPRDAGAGVFGQRFDSGGSRLGSEFQVNSYTTGYQYFSEVAVDASGGFVVVWMSLGQDGDNAGIFGQRYDSTGAPTGPEFQVNTYTTGDQADPVVAFDASGGFMVVWSSPHDGDHAGIFARRYDSAGLPQGDEFPLNVATAGDQFDPEIATDSTGGFIVTWASADGSGTGVVGRRFSAAGVAPGPEFRVNTYTTGHQYGSTVAATPNGGFVVAWTSLHQDGSDEGVYASLDCARLYTVAPCRLVDTRIPPGSPLGANTTRMFPLTGTCGIPADARALALNVTAVNPTDLGNLRLYAAGRTEPIASTLNFASGLTRANSAVIPVGTNGEIAVRCDMPPGSAGSTNLVLDVFGYFKR